MTELHPTSEMVLDAEIEHITLRERIACSRIGRAVLGGLTAASMAVGGTVVSTESASAESNYTYTVAGTNDEGVWLHGDPGIDDEGDLVKVMPEGTRFTADCYVNDSPVGERANPVWLHGHDETGASGYFTDYYSSSRWSAEDKSGLPPECGDQPSATIPKAETKTENDRRSVFYSPLVPPTGLRDVETVADINKSVNDWPSGDCTPERASEIPSSVDTLAGWSKGRLGPVYFLEAATDSQRNQIKNIILLDPGATSDMARNRLAEIRGRKTCDWQYDPSGLLADWLKENGANRLTIITGSDTEMKEDPTNSESHSTFKGLWEFYLADSWNQPFAGQVTICDYNVMDHEEVLRKFAHTIKERNMGCTAVEGYRLTEWHP